MVARERHSDVTTVHARPGARLVAVVCGLSMGVSSCSGTTPAAEAPSTAASSRARDAEHGRTEPTEAKDASRSQRSPDLGLRISLTTHCGVRSLVIDGRVWLADPPLGGHNPPSGWGENETDGYFTWNGSRGEFHGDGGQHSIFRLAPPGTDDPNAGCE
jgi:hypothetical protein